MSAASGDTLTPSKKKFNVRRIVPFDSATPADPAEPGSRGSGGEGGSGGSGGSGGGPSSAWGSVPLSDRVQDVQSAKHGDHGRAGGRGSFTSQESWRRIKHHHRLGKTHRHALSAKEVLKLFSTKRNRVWMFLEYPQTCLAKSLSYFMNLVIAVSLLCFVLETTVELASVPGSIWFFVEMSVTFIFSLELLVRVCACPSFRLFWCDCSAGSDGAAVFNWFDILAIAPFYIELISVAIDPTQVRRGIERVKR